MVFKRLFVVTLILSVGLVLVGSALTQVSTPFDVSRYVLSGGGGFRSSPHFLLGDTLGQWADGPATSAGYRISPGFWYGEPLPTQIYLPLVMR